MNLKLLNIFIITAILPTFIGCGGLTLEKTQNKSFDKKMLNSSSKSVQINSVRQNSANIVYIKNPDKDIQLAAVENHPMTIMYIKNPHKDVQLATVEKKPMAIKYIKNPDEDVQLATVKKDGEMIKYIKYPSKNVQLAAVTQNGDAIKYILSPHKDVQLMAVVQHKSIIGHIKNPDEDVQLTAVSKDKDAFQYIKKPCKKVKMYVDGKINNKPINYKLKNTQLSVKLTDISTLTLTNNTNKFIKINSFSEHYCNSITTISKLYIPPNGIIKQDAPNNKICNINSLNDKINYGFTIKYEISGSSEIFSLYETKIFTVIDLIK